MSLEREIKDAILRKLESGLVEKVIEEQFELVIKRVAEDLFGKWGECTNIIESKIKSVMVPYLEGYDYSGYVTKLDSVLVELLENTTIENRKLLGNFKELMSTDKSDKPIKMSDIFTKWIEFVKSDLDLELDQLKNYDGSSATVNISYEFEENYEYISWLNREEGRIIFECPDNIEYNKCIKLHRYKDIHKTDMWEISFIDKEINGLNSLRYLSEFDVFLLKMKQIGVEIYMDIRSDNNEIVISRD